MKSIRIKAARQFAQHPGFSTIVVLTLALTTGIASTVFSLFDAILLRPLPYPNSQRLVRVLTYKHQIANSSSDASVPDFRDWQKLNRSFTALAAYVSFANNLTGSGQAQVVRTTATSPDLFDLLATRPFLGRTFGRSEDIYQGDVRKVVLSYTLWRRLFAAKTNPINRVIQLGGQSYTVIGVMPPRFEYPDRTQAWIPLMAMYSANADAWWKLRYIRVNTVLGRLKSGVSLARAQSDMDRVMSALAKQYPATNSGIRARVLELRVAETGQVRPYVLLVSGSVLLLLAIGCLNVGSLFLARASARQREFAIRAALGASPFDTLRQLLAESLTYATLGAASGVALAFLGIHALTSLLPAELPDWMALRFDWRVSVFSIAVLFTTALLFGLAPFLAHRRPALNQALKQASRGSSQGKATAFDLRRLLIVAEIALTLLLLFGAGLMLRSFSTLMSADTGLKTDHLVVATVARYVPNASPADQVKAYSLEYQRVYQKLATLPGVRAASAGDDIPYLDQPETRKAAELFTRKRPTRALAWRGPAAGTDVMPGYFHALGIPLLAGRDFSAADNLGKPPVAIISRYTAKTFFPGRSPVGEQIRWGDSDTYNPWSTVIGVVGDTKWNPAERQPDVEVYWSAFQYPPSQIDLLIRTASSPRNLLPAVRRVIHAVSPNLAIVQNKTMQEIVDRTLWQHRLWSYALGVFASLALLLSGVGLYGLMSYLVARGTHEMGIRMAIGSSSLAIVGLVLRRGMRLVIFGLAIGSIGALASQRLLTSLLSGIGAGDPATYVAVVILVFVITLLACALPAWKASRIDPIRALREE